MVSGGGSGDVEVLRRLAAHVRGLPDVDIQALRGQLRTLLPDDPPWVGRFGRLLGGFCGYAHRVDPGSLEPVHATERLFARGPEATADVILDYAGELAAAASSTLGDGG